MVSLNSSIKFIDVSECSKDELIERLDSLLVKREKQIHAMSVDMGALNDRLNIVYNSNQNLEREKKELSEKVLKLQAQLRQELDNKEVLLAENTKLESELSYIKSSGSFVSSNAKEKKPFNIKNTAMSYLGKMKNVFNNTETEDKNKASFNYIDRQNSGYNQGTITSANEDFNNSENNVKNELQQFQTTEMTVKNSNNKPNKIQLNDPQNQSTSGGSGGVKLASEMEDYEFVF